MKKSLLVFLSIGFLCSHSLVNGQGVTTSETPENVIINPEHPLSTDKKDLRSAILKWSRDVLRSNDYKSVKAHPSAVYFPGNVKEGAVAVTKTVHLKHQKISDKLVPIVSHLNYSGPWSANMYSTGLYAPAGKIIEVEIPKDLLDKDISIKINSHSDNLGQWVAGKEDWRRMPMVSKVTGLKERTTRIASPFGGLIYICVSPKAASVEGDVVIKNAVEAPYFELGKTTEAQWAAQLKNNKAPWGELASDRIIITLPDSVLQTVQHPDSVMQLWNLIIGGEMDLAQIDTPFYRPQRMVVDEHIGGGFMHSGYPVMVHHSPTKHMLSEDIIANPSKLLTPSKGGANWGFFHEIGHNMQNMDWVFGGTTEVTCNLFSIYSFDRLMGGRDEAHSGISNKFTQDAMKKYFANGADYDKWKSDPFLALILFRQLQEGFGWETFKTFFRQYHDLAAKYPDGDYAKTDEQKRDLWVLNLSKITGRNLAPFFEKWGIGISDATKQAVASYPVWMPYNFPPED